MIFSRQFFIALSLFACASPAWCQQSEGENNAQPAPPAPAGAIETQAAQQQEPPDKRVFGVLPNYRTVNDNGTFTPIGVKQKFIIASKDSFDYPLALLAGGLAGVGQLTNQNPSFGQGAAGYARRLGTSYGDQAIGNLMTEAIFPSFLHEDPRYFRRGEGGGWSRTYYALTRIFVTRTDTGGRRFNFSEVLGNAAGVAISNSYYPDGRNVTDNVAKWGEQLATDALSQVLKEFWPDVKRKFFQRHKDTR